MDNIIYTTYIEDNVENCKVKIKSFHVNVFNYFVVHQ